MKTLIEIFEQHKLLDMPKRTLLKVDTDYKFGEYDLFDMPHPKLFGRYEIWKGNLFIKRIEKATDAEQVILKFEDSINPFCT